MRTDAHLEETLEDLNARIHAAEAAGPSLELLELYINRGTVLRLMGSVLSAVSDFEEAAELADYLEDIGIAVDAGLFVKTHVSLGKLLGGDGPGDAMAGCYATAAARIGEVGEGSRHYDERELIETCISCANDLVDAALPSGAAPFIKRAVAALHGRGDPWHMNRALEALNVSAKAFMDAGMESEAFEAFDEAIGIGYELEGDGAIEDPFELVFSLIYKGDLHERTGDMPGFVECHSAAAELMEGMAGLHRKVNPELLADVHRGISMALMGMGRAADAERHLLRIIELESPAMGRAIDELGIRRP
ncbi:MAG: hypothetical protein GX224_06900 [Thermoplasmatales archaeon]|nr:hypothetical protein [Thermoplasmatales archaeon]